MEDFGGFSYIFCHVCDRAHCIKYLINSIPHEAFCRKAISSPKTFRKQIDIPDVYRGPSESKLILGTEERGKGKERKRVVYLFETC